MNRVAVVILNYNGRALLEQFLPTVIRHSRDARLVVADNGSTDDSVTFLKERYPSVTIIAIGKNLGYSGGYNFALREIDTPYAVLLNSDVEVTEGWIDPILQIFESDPMIGAVQPKILSFRERNKFEYAGAAGGFVDSWCYFFCRGRLFDSIEEDSNQYDDTRQVFWASGACLFIKCDLFRQVEGFDEDFFAHMEEIDFCWQLKRMGFLVYYSGASKVYHVGGATLATGNPRKVYFNFRNSLFLMIKHLPSSQLVYKFPVRVLLDWVAAIQFLFSSWRASAAVVSAHGAVLRSIGKLIVKRKRLKLRLRYFDVGHVYPGLLIIDFFIRGKRRFSDLPQFPN